MTQHTDTLLMLCPFCGGKAYFEIDDDRWQWVECGSCGMQGNRSASLMEDCKPKLAEAWNRRAPVAPVPLRKPTLDQVAEAVGYHASAWDCVDPSELIDAILMLAAAPQPPESNSVEFHQIKQAAPVQMQESFSKVLEDCRSRAIDYATCPSPYNNTRMETAFQSLEHQVRQLLAAHGIK